MYVFKVFFPRGNLHLYKQHVQANHLYVGFGYHCSCFYPVSVHNRWNSCPTKTLELPADGVKERLMSSMACVCVCRVGESSNRYSLNFNSEYCIFLLHHKLS